jgi:hypothetical protein
VADGELCGVGFEGGEAVAEVGGAAVEGVRGRLRTEETAERRALRICPSKMSSWESLERPSWRVKCWPMRTPRMTRIMRDWASGEVERALMRNMVVRFSSCECFVKVREVLSSTPRTRYVSEGPMDGMGKRWESMVMKYFFKRDARRVRLAGERALPECQRAPVMQHFER